MLATCLFTVKLTNMLSCSCLSDGLSFLLFFSIPPPLSHPPQAFLSLCDVLTAHNYQLQVWDPSSYGPLLYTPDPKLQRALLAFILEHVFTGAEYDSHSRGETIDNSTSDYCRYSIGEGERAKCTPLLPYLYPTCSPLLPKLEKSIGVCPKFAGMY